MSGQAGERQGKPGRPSIDDRFAKLEAEMSERFDAKLAAKDAEIAGLEEAVARGGGSDADKIAATVAAAVAAAQAKIAADTGIFRRSRNPVVIEYAENRKNFDIKKEAEAIARAKGHDLGRWVTADRNDADGEKPFIHAKCRTCGAMATARWRGRPKNDTRVGPEAEAAEYPVLSGDALEKTEDQYLGGRKGRAEGPMSAVPV